MRGPPLRGVDGVAKLEPCRAIEAPRMPRRPAARVRRARSAARVDRMTLEQVGDFELTLERRGRERRDGDSAGDRTAWSFVDLEARSVELESGRPDEAP